MAHDFEPSPRASKRRRTATYKSSTPDNDAAADLTSPIAGTTENSGTGRKSRRSVVAVGETTTDRLSGSDANNGVSAETSNIQQASAAADRLSPWNAAQDISPNTGAKATNSTISKRLSRSSRKDKPLAHEHNNTENTDRSTPTRVSGGQDEDEKVQEAESEPTTLRSSGRERRKPRRYDVLPAEGKAEIHDALLTSAQEDRQTKHTRETAITPKGILTPSKKRRGRPPKTVVFDTAEKTIEEQFGFRDIDSSTQKKRVQPREAAAAAAVSSDQLQNKLKKSAKSSFQTPGTSVGPSVRGSDRDIREEPEDIDFDHLLEDGPIPHGITTLATDSAERFSLEEDPAVLAIKAQVLSRLIGSAPTSSSIPKQPPLPWHLQPAYKAIHDLLAATITTGESNSLLLLGSRGAGKSYLLNSALRELTDSHGNDFHTIRLDGFIQTDDKLALREIWRQLGREMKVSEEDGDKMGSYADTMASLLSILSHPDEFLDATMNDTAADIVEHGYGLVDGGQQSATKMSKSVVFILDEFDLFTTHPRQTLLYNLFDIAQSRKAPIAVIGCSTRMDVVECLEKRVKSRFSHRWIHVPNAKSVDGLEDIVKNALRVDDDPYDDVGRQQRTQRDVEVRRAWNTAVEKQLLPSQDFRDLVSRIFYTTKSVPDLLMALYLPVVTLPVRMSSSNGDAGRINAAPSSVYVSLQPTPHLVTLLPALPTLQLSLLVSAARLDAIHNLSAVNFNLVYDHYVELIARSKLQQTASGAIAVGAGVRQWTQEMAQDAWEDLGSWTLIVPASGVAYAGGRDVDSAEAAGGEGASVRMWKVDVSLEDLSWALQEKAALEKGLRSGPIDVLSRWCREI